MTEQRLGTAAVAVTPPSRVESAETAARGQRFFLCLIVLATLVTLAVRLPRLAERPMHCDEAVQAIKFGELLEANAYRYDPTEYHGPTLAYSTLPVALLSRAHRLVEADETTLRIVPVAFCAALVLLLPLIADGLSRRAVLVSAALTCLSPAMFYYSRYFVMEMLLVWFSFLTIASGWRYSREPRLRWAVLTGIGAGLMFATKETCVIGWFAMVVALLATLGRKARLLLQIPPRHMAAAVLAALAVSVLFFTSFFAHWQGFLDAFRTYLFYFDRSGGQGHQKPWFYYLKLLAWNREGGMVWSEALILGLAVCGTIAAFATRTTAANCRRRREEAHAVPIAASSPPHVGAYENPYETGTPAFVVFLTCYTVVMTAVYCLIPYKTPWIALNFLHGAILLAGFGAIALVRGLSRWRMGWLAALVLVAGCYNLGVQCWRGSFRFAADERNPYAYVPTSSDLMRLVKNIRGVAAQQPAASDVMIKVMSPEYWPLPWYLRDFTSIGYWSEIPDDPEAPIIITTPELVEKLAPRLKARYAQEMAGLRPGFILVAFYRQDLWEAMLSQRTLSAKR